MALPIYNGVSKDLSLLQTTWSQQINPVLRNAILNGHPLNDIILVANTPQAINHLLSKKQQGWFITDINANASVWRTEPFNSQTLTLEADANVTISMWVY